MTKLIFDKPSNSGFYDAVMKILGEITGVKWGFYKPSRRVQHLSSAEIPLTIGAIWGKNYEKNCKPLDIEISSKYPRFYEPGEWADAVGAELKRKLIINVSPPYLFKVLNWKPSPTYLAARAHADEQKKRWGDLDGLTYDKYNDDITKTTAYFT